MNKIALLLPVLAIAACSQEPEAAQAPAATASAPVPAATSSLPAPDQAIFTEVFAKACPEAAKVNTAVCKRAAFGSDEVECEYGLGDDTYLRNKAKLTPTDDEWALNDAETVCKTDLNKPAG